MSNYLTRVVASDGTELIIRDPEVWQYITEFCGTLEVIILNSLPDPNGTISSGEYAGEKWGAYYYGKIILTNEANIGTDNSYDEYIIRRDGSPGSYTYAWEKIGTTDLNMAAYSTKGHVHAVDTNVSVEDHSYTPEGSVSVTLKLSSTETQNVALTGAPGGTVKLEETNAQENNSNKVSFTPTTSSVTVTVNEAGEHTHNVGSTKRMMKKQNLSVDVTTEKKDLDKQDVEQFTMDGHETALKIANGGHEAGVDVAHVDGTTDLNIADKGKFVSLTFTDSDYSEQNTNGNRKPFVTGIQNTPSGQTDDVLAQAVATEITGESGHYKLSFTGKKFTTDKALIKEGAVDWGNNGTPLGADAFGDSNGDITIPNVENYNTKKDFYKFDKVAVPIPTDKATLTVVTGDTSEELKTSNFITGSQIDVVALNGQFNATGYDSNDTVVDTTGWQSAGKRVAISGAVKYKLAFKKIGGGSISTDDFNSLGISVYTNKLSVVKGLTGTGTTSDAVLTDVTPTGNTLNNVLTYDGYTWYEWLKVKAALTSNIDIFGSTGTLLVMDAYEELQTNDDTIFVSDSTNDTNLTNAVYSNTHKFVGTNVSSDERSVVEIYNSDGVRYYRARSSGSSVWSDLVSIARNSGSTWHVKTKGTKSFIGTIYNIKVYDRATGELLFNGVPAKDSNGNAGLYDLVNGDFKSFGAIGENSNLELPSQAISQDGTDIPFVDNVDGVTESSGTHTHNASSSVTMNTVHLKATYTGALGTMAATTPKTEVDNTGFTGTPETLTHTVHNPRVYTGPDDYDDYFRFNDWYGVQYDENVADSAKTRIGNMTMHKTLPIQSRMRRCLLNDDGTVNYYLDANDSRLKADGTAADLTGTDGQVMVEIPKHWRKVTKDANDVVTAMISPYKQEGWIEVPKSYVSAYEARIVSNKLCSVSNIVNLSIALQDGIPVVTCDLATAANQAAITSALPTTNVTMDALRSAARARHSVDGDPDTRWNMLVYESYLAVYWLYVIEYANTNSQAAFNSALTADGYHQGGLGAGCTTLTSANWNTFSGGGTSNYKPFIPCGVTNVLGNNSGEVKVVIPTSLDSSGVIKVCSYRGIENPFGHIWKFADGIKYLGNGSNQNVLRCDTPSNYSSASNSTNYTSIGTNVDGNGVYKKKIMVGDDGDINCAATGGSDATYYCDYNYEAHANGTYYCCLLGGSASSGPVAGLACVRSAGGVSRSSPDLVSRLCFFEK